MKKIPKQARTTKTLKKSKVKGIGFFERIVLKFVGRRDGKRGLPKECDDGSWQSPHLNRELHSFSEFNYRIWGQLQIESQNNYARMQELMDSIIKEKPELEKAKEMYTKEKEELEKTEIFRKEGEERLSHTQVLARRTAENAKKLVPFQSKINALETQLESETREFISLRSRILEDNNNTKMTVKRVKSHLFQRTIVYWDSTLYKHAEANRMPMTPSVESKADKIQSEAETVYLSPHKALMDRADTLSNTLTQTIKEVA